jgi:hypothetical protein
MIPEINYFVFDGRWPSDRSICMYSADSLEDAINEAPNHGEDTVVIQAIDGVLQEEPVWRTNEYDCPIHGKCGGTDECPRC